MNANEGSPFFSRRELVGLEKLAVRSLLLVLPLEAFLVNVVVLVVVVQVFRSVLSVAGFDMGIHASVWDVVPAGLGLVRVEHVLSIMPSKELVHLV